MIPVTFRPIEKWPGVAQNRIGQRRSPFSAGWTATMALLDRELRALAAERVVIQLALAESDIRLDGWPRAGARPEHPGVVLAFESPLYGPLQYPGDAFDKWQDNLRAIALGLEALRRVDRYGITRHGEQYTGWKALPSGGMDAGDAAQLLRSAGGGADDMRSTYRRALMATHPDHGGDRDGFERVQQAGKVLGVA